MLDDRATLEDMIRVTGGRQVKIGNEQTWGHYEIVDELALEDRVVVGAPVIRVPSCVPGFVEGASVDICDIGTSTVRFSQRETDGAIRVVVLREN